MGNLIKYAISQSNDLKEDMLEVVVEQMKEPKHDEEKVENGESSSTLVEVHHNTLAVNFISLA